jgi:hypothetical protein
MDVDRPTEPRPGAPPRVVSLAESYGSTQFRTWAIFPLLQRVQAELPLGIDRYPYRPFRGRRFASFPSSARLFLG